MQVDEKSEREREREGVFFFAYERLGARPGILFDYLLLPSFYIKR